MKPIERESENESDSIVYLYVKGFALGPFKRGERDGGGGGGGGGGGNNSCTAGSTHPRVRKFYGPSLRTLKCGPGSVITDPRVRNYVP